jgi:hypothetical protein
MGNNQDKCAVCSQGPDGNPLVSPGCCKGWYHHACLKDQISNKGCTTCSQCNTVYSAAIIQAHMSVPTAIAQAISPNIVQGNQFQQIPAQANMFFPPAPPITSKTIPQNEDPVESWISPVSLALNASSAAITIDSIPELYFLQKIVS